MSQIKQLAFWLAKCVYKHKMDDAAILAVAKSRYQVSETWLLKQIKAVRNHPEIYNPIIQ